MAQDSPIHKEVSTLKIRHGELRTSHDELKTSIEESVHHQLFVHGTQSSIVKSFAEKSMATIAAWISSQTWNAIIILIVEGSTPSLKTDMLLTRGIYAGLTTFFVPFCQWLLSGYTKDQQDTFVADQVQLLKQSLPMFFAWAWKDFVQEIMLLKEDVWFDFVVAFSFTVVIAACEALPCFRRNQAALKDGGSLCARIGTTSGSLGVATGFAWNMVFSYAPEEAQKHTDVGLFIFMIQVVYYLFITWFITLLTLKWTAHVDAKKVVDRERAEAARQARQEARGQQEHREATGSQDLGLICDAADDVMDARAAIEAVAEAEEALLEKTGQVFMDALGFIYAWAQLDTINDFFFTYMLGCSSSSSCSYQSNFAFAAAITVIFTRLAGLWKVERRRSTWNQAGTVLANKALALNVGWAWSNYCSAAITDAVGNSGLETVYTYLVCSAFAWLVMSFVHRKFEVERRAWKRHVTEQTTKHGLSVSIA